MNPCERCAGPCRYRLFIDCPKWQAWAEEQNREDDQDEEDENNDAE